MTNTWSIGETKTFLKAYRRQTCIWNPADVNHKDRKKVAAAWSKLGLEFNKPVKELKSKKEVLMAIFRKHFKRKQASIRSGAGPDAVYQPRWFAYQLMESFLLPVYNSNYTLKTDTESEQHFRDIDKEPEVEEMDNDTSILDNGNLNTARPTPRSTKPRSRLRAAPNLAEQQMADAFGKLANELTRRFEHPSTFEEDECDLYGKLLAIKLRELPYNERQMLMYHIDGLFIDQLNANPETP